MIQRRGDFNRSKHFFFKDWSSYKRGFGDIEKDFWLGERFENIFFYKSNKSNTKYFSNEIYSRATVIRGKENQDLLGYIYKCK